MAFVATSRATLREFCVRASFCMRGPNHLEWRSCCVYAGNSAWTLGSRRPAVWRPLRTRETVSSTRSWVTFPWSTRARILSLSM